MALPPLLKRRAPEAKEPRTAGVAEADELQSRTRARRRLIGAAVLLAVGVIAFPLLFETQPRPVAVDIPMVIPAREGATPLSPPARPARAASGGIGDASGLAATAPAQPIIPVTRAPADQAAPAPPAATVPVAATPAPTGQAIQKPAPERSVEKTADATRGTAAPPTPAKPATAAKPERERRADTQPRAEPAAKPSTAPRAGAAAAAKPAAESDAGRFVVQVGAYADEGAARAVRQRVERMGLKTYTQEVTVRGARWIRVRVGPFASRQAAEKALETVKAGKLTGVVLTL
jgi:DedD protein